MWQVTERGLCLLRGLLRTRFLYAQLAGAAPGKGAGATPVLTCLSLCSAAEAHCLPEDTTSQTGVVSCTGVISGISLLCESSPTQISGKDHKGHFLDPYQTLYYNAPKH